MRALETGIKHRPVILIGGVPIGESTDGQIIFEITCMHKIQNAVACDDFLSQYATVNLSSNFARNLRNSIKGRLQIFLPASHPKLVKPRAVRLHHRRGVKVVSPNRLPVKCVDRTSRWGNPFEIGRDGTREEVIQKYRDWFLTGTEPGKIGRYIVDPRRLSDHIHELRGFNLACCRPGSPCHADFLLEQANRPEPTLQGATET